MRGGAFEKRWGYPPKERIFYVKNVEFFVFDIRPFPHTTYFYKLPRFSPSVFRRMANGAYNLQAKAGMPNGAQTAELLLRLKIIRPRKRTD